jgi:acyl carrier protein
VYSRALSINRTPRSADGDRRRRSAIGLTMPEPDVRVWIRDYLAKLLGISSESVSLDTELDTYGLDSVDAVLMAGELEDALNIEIDPAAFLQHPTIEAMVSWLEQQAALRGRL